VKSETKHPLNGPALASPRPGATIQLLNLCPWHLPQQLSWSLPTPPLHPDLAGPPHPSRQLWHSWCDPQASSSPLGCAAPCARSPAEVTAAVWAQACIESEVWGAQEVARKQETAGGAALHGQCRLPYVACTTPQEQQRRKRHYEGIKLRCCAQLSLSWLLLQSNFRKLNSNLRGRAGLRQRQAQSMCRGICARLRQRQAQSTYWGTLSRVRIPSFCARWTFACAM